MALKKYFANRWKTKQTEEKVSKWIKKIKKFEAQWVKTNLCYQKYAKLQLYSTPQKPCVCWTWLRQPF